MVVRHNATHGLLNTAAVFVVFVGHKRRAFAFSSDSDKLIGFVPFILVLTVFGPVALRIVRDRFPVGEIKNLERRIANQGFLTFLIAILGYPIHNVLFYM